MASNFSTSVNIAKSCLKLITFDVTNTLARVRGTIGDIYSKAALASGLEIDAGLVNLNFRRSYKKYDRMHPNFGIQHGLSPEEWWSNVVRGALASPDISTVDESTLDALCAKLYKDFARETHWEIFPEIPRVLSHLRAKGYILGVISNFDERLDVILEAMQLHKYFSFTVPSVKVKTCKPSLEIFKFSLKKVGVEAREALHIGDSLLLDYEPAVELGMHALLVDRQGALVRTRATEAVQVIRDMRPLLSL